jgi:hypothetical protein
MIASVFELGSEGRIEEGIERHHQVLHHGKIRERRDVDDALLQQTHARFARQPRDAVDRHRARPAHADPARAAKGERRILLALHTEERIEHGHAVFERYLEVLRGLGNAARGSCYAEAVGLFSGLRKHGRREPKRYHTRGAGQHSRGEPGSLVSEVRTMIPLEKMTDAEFERHALCVLRRELGLDGLARFLRVYRARIGDYTRDRHRWLEGATIQEIMAEVERRGHPNA